jgi:hypothetical protein
MSVPLRRASQRQFPRAERTTCTAPRPAPGLDHSLDPAHRNAPELAEVATVAESPDHLTLVRHRDRAGRRETIARRVGLTLLSLFALAALLNLFGQRPATSSASVSAATLKIYGADRVRGGLYYETRYHVHARTELKDATLVLDSGWLEGMTVNTVEPSPVSEASRDGKLALELGHVPAGQEYLLFIQYQVNPTNIGHRRQKTWLYDGDTLLTSVTRTVTVFP